MARASIRSGKTSGPNCPSAHATAFLRPSSPSPARTRSAATASSAPSAFGARRPTASAATSAASRLPERTVRERRSRRREARSASATTHSASAVPDETPEKQPWPCSGCRRLGCWKDHRWSHSRTRWQRHSKRLEASRSAAQSRPSQRVNDPRNRWRQSLLALKLESARREERARRLTCPGTLAPARAREARP